jgi:hypothetical protein
MHIADGLPRVTSGLKRLSVFMLRSNCRLPLERAKEKIFRTTNFFFQTRKPNIFYIKYQRSYKKTDVGHKISPSGDYSVQTIPLDTNNTERCSIFILPKDSESRVACLERIPICFCTFSAQTERIHYNYIEKRVADPDPGSGAF